MSRRKTRLVDLNPHWVEYNSMGVVDAVYFDCPEGHEDCKHVIPFTPALDGSRPTREPGRAWERTGETFETLTLSPSIRRIRKYSTRDEAIADGCLPEYVTESLLCAFHGFIKNGQIEFCGDSE